MSLEIANIQEQLMQEIQSPEIDAVDVAKTYALAVRQKTHTFDAAIVNRAIRERWGVDTLNHIKNLAWSAKCFRTDVMVAISIRQPWAWLIAHGFKTIENRQRYCSYRGLFAIHASKGMTHKEYDHCAEFTNHVDPSIKLPHFDDLERGGIVGEAKLVNCVNLHKFYDHEEFIIDNPWFVGPYGLVIQHAHPVKFVPCKGQLAVPFKLEVQP